MTKLYDVRPMPGRNPQIGLLLSMLDDGATEWRSELEDVPDEASSGSHFRTATASEH